jgi:hypothetical protein
MATSAVWMATGALLVEAGACGEAASAAVVSIAAASAAADIESSLFIGVFSSVEPDSNTPPAPRFRPAC